MIVELMKENKLFAPQGGPIILAQVCIYLYLYFPLLVYLIFSFEIFANTNFPSTLQIENEYNHVQLAYDELGVQYVQWAANLAVGLGAGVPWIMCKQKDAPDPVVSLTISLVRFLICVEERN